MSALSYICGYGYGSEESDSEYERPANTKRQIQSDGAPLVFMFYKNKLEAKLPLPDLSKVPTVPVDCHEDDPILHGGRTRAFPHVRGNWATFVYVKFPKEEAFLNLVKKLQAVVLSVDDACEESEDIHISLSKTFVLKYHTITPFTTSLQKALDEIERFELAFDSIKVYCNDDNTRTFIALQVDHLSNAYLSKITRKIDDVLVEFKLPIFYDDPSFHMSILWLNGNKRKELESILDNLNSIVTQEIDNSIRTLTINKVNCRSGNKHFQYSLH